MKKLFVSIAAIALTTASLVPKPALAGQPNVQLVGSAESGDKYFLDYNSLRRNGAIIEYYSIVQYNSTHYDEQDHAEVGLFRAIRGNCLTGKYQFIGTAIAGPGWVITEFNDTPSSVRPVLRDTVAAMVLVAACQATN